MGCAKKQTGGYCCRQACTNSPGGTIVGKVSGAVGLGNAMALTQVVGSKAPSVAVILAGSMATFMVEVLGTGTFLFLDFLLL